MCIVVFLSRRELWLYELLPDGAVDASYVKRFLGKSFSRPYLMELLDRLAAKGALARVRNGVFFKNAEKNADLDFLAGMALGGGKCFAAVSSALYFHGLLDEQPSVFYFATRNKRKRFSFNDNDYVLVPFGKDFRDVVEQRGVLVSSIPKTLFDCLKRPRLAGGISKVVEATQSARLSDGQWKELLGYSCADSFSLMQKTGFVLEGIAPTWFLRRLLESTRNSRTIARLGKTGKYDAKWKVVA